MARTAETESFMIAVRVEPLYRAIGVYDHDVINEYLNSLVPSGTVSYRKDAEYFHILLQPTTDAIKTVTQTAETILCRFAEPWAFSLDNCTRQVLLPVSICVLPKGAADAQIEQALDTSRRTGDVTVFGCDSRPRFHNTPSLETLLKKAVKNRMQGFYLLFDPFVDITGGLWRGLEVSCHWSDAELGEVPSERFMPAARTLGLNVEIDLWVMEQAMTTVKQMHLHLLEGFFLTYAVSPASITENGFDKRMLSLLERTGYPPSRFILGLYETKHLRFSQASVKALEHVLATGVSVMLNDFGIGCATFLGLTGKHAAHVILTQPLTAAFETHNHIQPTITRMADKAKETGTLCMATGVDRFAIAEKLKHRHITLMQGLYFTQPLTIDELIHKAACFCETEQTGTPHARASPKIIDSRRMDAALCNVLNRYVKEVFRYEMESENQLRENILHHLECVVYITDLNTDEVLFANRTTERLCGAPLVGKRCFEVLHGRTKRCDFCPILQLLKHPGISYQWTFYSSKHNKHFKVQDSMIPWVGGKLAHLVCAAEMNNGNGA